LGEIEETMEAFEARPIRYEADDLALAGAFVSIDSSGRLRVERGYVRPEDEPVEEVEDTGEVAPDEAPAEDIDDTVASTMDEEEEDDGLKPLSDRLVMELTAHRTLALRNALVRPIAFALSSTYLSMASPRVTSRRRVSPMGRFSRAPGLARWLCCAKAG